MFSIEIQTAGWIWMRFGTEVFLEGGKVMGFLCNLQICWLWQISVLIKVLVKFRNNIKMSHFMVVRTIKVIKIQTCLFSGPKCKCQVSDLSAPADQAPCWLVQNIARILTPEWISETLGFQFVKVFFWAFWTCLFHQGHVRAEQHFVNLYIFYKFR